MTQEEQINMIIGAIWLVCLVVCGLKGKWGLIIISVAGGVAEAVGPLIFGNYILNAVGEPLGLLPYFGAIRLANPKSYWAFWFYRSNPAKYALAVQRFGLEKEWGDLISKRFFESEEYKKLAAEIEAKREPQASDIELTEAEIKSAAPPTAAKFRLPTQSNPSEEAELKTSCKVMTSGSYCVTLRQGNHYVYGFGNTLWEAERAAVLRGKKPYLMKDGSWVTMFRGAKWQRMVAAVEASIAKEKARREISGDAPWRNS